MAVNITTEFYEYDTPGWHDLAKVVFTSPNIDSPATAGTRSNILPGETDLGTWREDTSEMYRAFDEQAGSSGYMYDGHPQFEEGEYVNDLWGTTASGFHIYNTIKFELIEGENYSNRATAWDDVTHSTTDGVVFNDGVDTYLRASCVAYRYTVGAGTVDNPETIVEVHPPVYNQSFKGDDDIAWPSGYRGYYADDYFNMIYATPVTGHIGDILLVRPCLIGIDSETPYGVHDFVVTLHYSYS